MRPSVTDTPPLSYEMTKKILPIPILMCGLDWKNLTTDNSIQILDSSEYIQDESVYFNSYVTNHMDIVDNRVSPYADNNESFCADLESTQDDCGQDLCETSSSENSSTHQNGGFVKSRIFCAKGAHDSKTIDITNGKFESVQQFKRARYSDSDIIVRLAGDTPRRQANVARSRSVGWAESVKQFGDVSLVKPLKPSAYVTKISDVKRLPSFRSTNKPETKRMSDESLRQDDGQKLNESVTVTQENSKSSDNMQSVQFQVPKLKIAKFVKNGLKSVKRSKDFLRKVGQTDQYYEQELKKQRQRGTRYSTGITGLSEFLRKNERRKTLSDIPELPHRDNTVAKFVENGPKTTTCSADSVFEKLNKKSNETPSLIAANGKRKTTGTSNLKIAQCQRKLSFNVEGDVSKSTKDEVRETDCNKWTRVVGNSNITTRRPRLGIVSSRKPVSLVSIDHLEMDTVLDLKRRLERTSRCTRIKTNGSLKPQIKTLSTETIGTKSPIWRKSFRYSRVSGTKPIKIKRESIV